MPIKSFDPMPEGAIPDPEDHTPDPPHFLAPLMTAWWKAEAKDPLPMAVANRKYRASWAGLRCDRQLQYAIDQVPESNVPSVADFWRMKAGTNVHLAVGGLVADVFKGLGATDVLVEQPIDLEPIGLSGAASSDLLIHWAEGFSPTGATWTAVELKSLGGFAFKKMACQFDGPPTGPRWGNVTQGCLAAAGWAAATGKQVDTCIAYLSLELVSAGIANKRGMSDLQRFAAEWWFDATQSVNIAQAEVARVNEVLQYSQGNVLVPRWIHDPELAAPGVPEVINPLTGTLGIFGPADADEKRPALWGGKTWMCDYCRHQDRCIEDG